MSKKDCGCGCGGAPAAAAAFVRPRFFAGQLLTEDDLSLLVDYVAGKDRLHNRMVSGPGVVCGLEVGCDPCGGSTVTVGPGHALDCCGNDIVVSCKEKVDVAALVRELRVSSLGVDCGDPCDDDQRHYGLFVRYEENPVAPVAPYATEEPCPTPGCVPSRVQEGFRFVVKCDTTDDHRFNPGTRLLASIGPEGKYEDMRLRSQRLGLYLDAIHIAEAAATQPIRLDEEDRARYRATRTELGEIGEKPDPATARLMIEHVRGLASAIARHDTYDPDERPALDDVDGARQVLGTACTRLAGITAWPNDSVRQSLFAAVVAEAQARVVTPDTDSPVELRLVAQGTPASDDLRAEFRADLVHIREWLLGRIDRAPGVADCRLRDDVRATPLPQPLPAPDLGQIAEAAGTLTMALQRFVTDAACATLNPPCTDCTDTDVLLAHLELDGCDVARVCSATREQVLPGGSAYGEWLPKLYRLRQLASEVCCKPPPVYQPPNQPAPGPVARPYPAGLFEAWPRTGDLERMWSLLMRPAPGETPPKPVHEQVYTVPNEVTDSLQELNVLRSQVSDLVATVEALRSQLDTARDQVTQVREELPERLEARLSELESTPSDTPTEASTSEEEPAPKPPARRTRSSTRKPRSGSGSGSGSGESS